MLAARMRGASSFPAAASSRARVEVAQATDCAYGGDAAVQLQTCVLRNKAVGDGSRETACHDLLYQRLVIALLLLGFAVACQVHMHVYEAREQIGALEIKGLAAGQIGISLRRDIGDTPSLYHNNVVFKHLHTLGSVEHVCVDVRRPSTRGSGAGADLCHV